MNAFAVRLMLLGLAVQPMLALTLPGMEGLVDGDDFAS
jgi:hypothetical protein